MQFLIRPSGSSGEARQSVAAHRQAERPAAVRRPEEAVVPEARRPTRSSSRPRARPMQDLLFRVKLDVLSNKIREKIVDAATQGHRRAIQDYYNKNKARFSQPERRDLQVVLTKTRPRPTRPRARSRAGKLGHGRQEVLDRPGLEVAGRQAPGRRQGPAGQGFRRADLRAPRRARSSGPVKTQFGYYVFHVTKITPARSRRVDRSRTQQRSSSACSTSQQRSRRRCDRSSRTSTKKLHGEDATAARLPVDRALLARRRPDRTEHRPSSRATGRGADHARRRHQADRR